MSDKPGRRTAGWLLAFGAFACLIRLWEGDLDMWDGISHAEVAWQILVTGDWTTMHTNGSPVFQKPPLYFWVTAGLMNVLGPTSLAARLLPALCGILTMALTFAIARRVLGERSAALALLCLVSTVLFLKYSRRAMHDVPVAAWTTLGVYAVLRGLDEPRWFWVWGVSLALGYYTKAIQGLYVLPIGLLTLLLARPRRLWSLHLLGGLGLAAGLVAPWVVAQTRLHGEAFLGSHAALGGLTIALSGFTTPAGRVDRPRLDMQALADPWLTLVREDWPWILVSYAGLFLLVKGWSRKPPGHRLLAIWPLVIMAQLSVAPYFGHRRLVAVLPPLSIAASCALSRWLSEAGSARLLRWGGWALAGIAAAWLIPGVPVIERPGTRTSDLVPLARAAAADPVGGPILALHQDPPWEAVSVFSFYGRRHVELTDTARLGDRASKAAAPMLMLCPESDVRGLVRTYGRRFRVVLARSGQCLAALGPPGRAFAPASGNVIR